MDHDDDYPSQCVQTGKGRTKKTDRRCAHLAIDHFGLSANLASEENRLDSSDFWLQHGGNVNHYTVEGTQKVVPSSH